MHRTLAVCRNGLTVVAAVALLTACGGSDDDTAGSTSSSSSSAATSESGASDAAFCTQAAELLAEVTPAVTGSGDPTTLAPTLAQAVTDAQAIEPPAAIAEQWSALTDGLEQFATAAAAVNPSDAASVEQFTQLKAQLLGHLAGPAGSVQTFLGQKCGLSTGSAAPTS
ncbi:MAG TPA: hypothetical protein VNC79_11260 [Mycobacteriales bacterium]|nr:hypothetical protein [Mycobacteriales bacterium]